MKRVLVVDDEPHMLRVLQLFLERAGYSVNTCPNGEAALAAIMKQAPDVMITDIQMPKMSGQQLCQALVEQLPQRRFPIFVMTSMTDQEHREWTANIENLEFLEKPLSMRILSKRLEEYFRENEGARAAGNA